MAPSCYRRRLTRALLAWLVLAGLGGVLSWSLDYPLWIPGVTLALLPVLLALGLDRYRNLGNAVVGARVVFRHGSLVRRRVMIDGDGIVGWTVRQSIFQRGSNLVTLTATTAAGRQGYSLPDVDSGVAVRIADAVSPSLLTPFLATAPD